MKLIDVLKNIKYEVINGDNLFVEVKDICYDSRKVKEGDAFVALVGIDTDGHKYIDKAIENGACCCIVCKDVCVNSNIPIIKIENTRQQLSYLSANLFENPQKDLIKIGITGTKGKTSTAFMIKEILEIAGFRVGVIGTIGTYINNKLFQHKNTTPESYQIQKYMRLMVDSGVKYLIMEVSSQALKVGRVNNIIFDYAIFTNLSIDHVGPREHPTFDDYIQSKALLFKQSKIGILNKDDSKYNEMVREAQCKIYTYGKNNDCDLIIDDINYIHNNDFLGIDITTKGIVNDKFLINAPGGFSSYNASGAILLCKLLNIDMNIIKQGLKTFKVAGRCEIINANKFKVVIDFAHNKISMESIINTMRQYNPNKIIAVFGCGGGRSFERRYELGEISGKLADLTIITTDNPRYDDIDEINRDIAKGIKDNNGKYVIIKDREEAIKYAMNIACCNDIILLLGKGHEKFQEINGHVDCFDEEKIVLNYLKMEEFNEKN